jgi:cytochrome b561
MKVRSSEEKYGLVAIIFHWLIATLIICQIAVGLYMVDLPLSLEKVKFYGWHKEFGLAVLFLASLRLLWRLSGAVPLMHSHAPAWQQFAARAAHFLLYVSMFIMPITGWLLSSATGFPVSFFGLFVMPDLITANEDMRVNLTLAHEWIGFGLIGLIGLHVAGAFYNLIIQRENVFKRMWP